MRSVVIIAFIFGLCTACHKKTTCSEKDASGDCVCITLYDPVCGCNKKTYSNSCEAECHGIRDYTSGECK